MINHTAFLEELVKIGEDAAQGGNKDRLIRALKTIGLASVGGAAGVGVAGLVEKAFPSFMQAQKPVQSGYVRAVQIGLPILGAMSLSLGSKYRQMVDDGLAGKPPENDRRT